MIRAIGGVMVFNDLPGLRISMTYTEIDENTGDIIADNKRLDKIIVDSAMKEHARAILQDGQTIIDQLG